MVRGVHVAIVHSARDIEPLRYQSDAFMTLNDCRKDPLLESDNWKWLLMSQLMEVNGKSSVVWDIRWPALTPELSPVSGYNIMRKCHQLTCHADKMLFGKKPRKPQYFSLYIIYDVLLVFYDILSVQRYSYVLQNNCILYTSYQNLAQTHGIKNYNHGLLWSTICWYIQRFLLTEFSA